jgi:hypothetical protein
MRYVLAALAQSNPSIEHPGPGSDRPLPRLTRRWPRMRSDRRAGQPGIEWTRPWRA